MASLYTIKHNKKQKNNQSNRDTFEQYQLNFNCNKNIFEQLKNETIFEEITKGRLGANLYKKNNNCIVPIIRTTTIYKNPMQSFTVLHEQIIEKIQEKTHKYNCKFINYYEPIFDNALIEVYNSEYHKMKEHSEQALDLEDNSYICVFSCYSNPDSSEIRTLKIKNKENKTKFEIKMLHNSIIIFSTNCNKLHTHKIVLENENMSNDGNEWLGITFRKSKTYIKFVNEIPYFYVQDNKKDIVMPRPLQLACEEEARQFYSLQKSENKYVDFKYPTIRYTINPSDLLMSMN